MGRIDVGTLRDRVEVLALSQEDGDWRWTAARRVWAKVADATTVRDFAFNRSLLSARNMFSAVGMTARTTIVVMRAQPLTLFDALRYNGQHLFLTDVGRPVDGYMTVVAAAVELQPCRANPGGEPPGVRFPAVLTEKYMKHEQLEPMAVNKICYVLVTPKKVELRPGALVDVDGTAYEVLVAHVIDPYKNEYEVLRKRDL